MIINFSNHARKRMQQRGISELAVKHIVLHGECKYDGHGGKIFYINKKTRNLIPSDLPNEKFKDIRKNGEFIILSEPSEHIKKFFGLSDWVENTKNELKKITDRKIIVHSKQSPTPLKTLMTKAWAFVSYQSTAGFEAMISGVPAYFTYDSLKHINPINNIERGGIDYELFNNISYSQWTLKEIYDGALIEYL